MIKVFRVMVMGLVLACILLGIWQLRGPHPARQFSDPVAAALRVLKPVAVAVPEPEFQAPLTATASKHDAETSPVRNAESTSPTVKNRCWRTGPLDEGEIRAVLKRFAAPEYGARVIQETRHDKVADWVYLPPLPSSAAAREEQRRLGDLGVQDLAGVTTGPMRNGLSLGLFAEPGGALRRVAELKALGVTARIEPRYRDLERNFMVVRSATVPDAEHSWRSVACE
ncbi:MAG: hypothetical protein V4457_10570 [Pseudomonadota bacterium]